jgi:flagellar hook-associated protein 1 FlgK
MSGLATVLRIAKDAMAAQQYGIDVTAHNIANVNTPSYSRQSPVYEARGAAPYGGVLLGQGVDVTRVVRASDWFIESRLTKQKSSMFSFDEMENYMQVLEGLFNEDSESSISHLMADFWNKWHDIANNPSGSSERVALYEHSLLLTDQFRGLNTDLSQLETDLTNAVTTGIERINQITNEIAYINDQIVGIEASGTANDLRDKRNELVSELAEYIGVKTFEQSNGSLTIVTARGCILVDANSSYNLQMGGDDGNRVLWQGSGGAAVDITDHVTNGKLGGWLDMRDEVFTKYKKDLDALVKEFVWTVNRQHSQGVGLEAFGAVTGTYASSSCDKAVGTSDSGLTFYDKVTDGSFKIWLYDENGEVVIPGGTTISIDADTTPLHDSNPATADIVSKINEIDPNITATIDGGRLRITASNGCTFAFSDDTSNVLAALGVNTLFTGSTAGGISVNTVIGSDKNCIAAAQIDDNGAFASGDNSNAIAISDLQYAATNISQWTCDRLNGESEGSVNATIEDYYHSMVGSIGIKSSSISRSSTFNEVMVNKLGGIRDSISAVSLDEEMTNLMKFQHAYAAAAKLIEVSDEMLTTLLSLK